MDCDFIWGYTSVILDSFMDGNVSSTIGSEWFFNCCWVFSCCFWYCFSLVFGCFYHYFRLFIVFCLNVIYINGELLEKGL